VVLERTAHAPHSAALAEVDVHPGLPRQPSGPDRVRAGSSELVLEDRDSDGVLRRRMVVEDGLSTAPERARVQRDIARWEAELGANPQWRAPEVVDGELVVHNDASRWFFASPALREWRRDLVPTAAALYPIQRPGLDAMPSGAPVDESARAFFAHTSDSIGVRTRAVLVQDAIRRAHALAPGARAPVWVSLACGAAVPVLDALGSGLHGGLRPRLELVDHDPDALAFARRLATAEGLVEGTDFRVLERDLVATVVARDALVDELGEGSASVVDAVGIFEYFTDASCVRLLRNAHRLLAPGGVLVVANMLADRPDLEFNRRGAGWPRLHYRSVGDLVDLVRRAGLPLDRTTISTPQDGVYAVVDVVR